MSNFTAIDLDVLGSVTGGAGDAPNTARTKADGNIGVT